MARLAFGFWSLRARFDKRSNHCPYCGSIFHTLLQRKKLLIQARKCFYCGLIFRWPPDNADKARRFYEEEYRSDVTTDLPCFQELLLLRESGFRNSAYEKPRYVQLVKETLDAPARILDFGSSWGFVGYQLQRQGYEVEGFDLSRKRAEFGREHLGFSIHCSWEELRRTSLPRFDMILTAHTLEHVYDLNHTLERFSEVILPDGALLAIVPNAGGRDARRLGVAWGPFIGETHTIAFTADWFQRNLPRHGFDVTSLFSPTSEARDEKCEGEELVCVARYRE